MKKTILISFIALVALTIILLPAERIYFRFSFVGAFMELVLSVFVYFSFYKSTEDHERTVTI